MGREMQKRPRPTPELLNSLRAGKAELRRERQALSLRGKVAGVLVLQRVCLPLIRKQRALEPWEAPWNLTP